MKSNRVSPYPSSQCFVSALRAYVPTAEAPPPPLFSLHKVTYEHAYENYQRQQHHICYYAIDGTMKQCQFFIKPFCWIDRTAEAFFCLNMPAARWTANTETFKTCQQLLVRAPNISCKYSVSAILWISIFTAKLPFLLMFCTEFKSFTKCYFVKLHHLKSLAAILFKVVELNLDYRKCQQ